MSMDLSWVVGSYLLPFVAPFSSSGRWIVAIVAELVLAFAILQWLGIRKIRKGRDMRLIAPICPRES